MSHDHTLHAAVAFDGAPEMIDAGRQCQHEFKALAGDEGHPLLERAGRLAGIRHDFDPVLSQEGTLKPVRFPALVPHHQEHGLPCRHVHLSRRQAKFVNDDGHLLILGGTSRESQKEDCQAFDHSQAPC